MYGFNSLQGRNFCLCQLPYELEGSGVRLSHQPSLISHPDFLSVGENRFELKNSFVLNAYIYRLSIFSPEGRLTTSAIQATSGPPGYIRPAPGFRQSEVASRPTGLVRGILSRSLVNCGLEYMVSNKRFLLIRAEVFLNMLMAT